MINILVVEDDAKLNQIVCTYLNDSGFQAKGRLFASILWEKNFMRHCLKALGWLRNSS